MSVGMALFTLWFPVLVFHNLVGCFTRPGLVFHKTWFGVSQDLVWCFTRPGLVFHKTWFGVSQGLVWCFTRPGLVFRNRPTVLFKLVFGGKSAFLVSAAALLS